MYLCSTFLLQHLVEVISVVKPQIIEIVDRCNKVGIETEKSTHTHTHTLVLLAVSISIITFPCTDLPFSMSGTSIVDTLGPVIFIFLVFLDREVSTPQWFNLYYTVVVGFNWFLEEYRVPLYYGTLQCIHVYVTCPSIHTCVCHMPFNA